jgi:hypothetical protein
MKKQIYLAAADLPNTRQSIRLILDSLELSSLSREARIVICHTDNFSWDLQSELSHYDLDLAFLNSGYSNEHYEYPVLHELWKASQNDDFYALYLHTKGASKKTLSGQRNAAAWSKIMLAGVLDNYQLCEYHLDRGADLVGALWYRHFKGNFWWGRSDYLRILTDPILMDHDYRNHAEFWCAWGYWWGRFPPPRVKNLFYLDDYKTDDSFLKIEKTQKLNIHSQTVFVDKRIDPAQPSTIEEFASDFDLRNFDKIYITKESTNMIPSLKNYLNYDGLIIIADPEFKQELTTIHYNEL